MKLSEIDAPEAFKQLLQLKAIDTGKIFASGEMPSSGLPSDFINVAMNGAVESESRLGGIRKCTIACSINVKLVKGSVNKIRNRAILSEFEDIFDKTASNGEYNFTLDERAMIVDTKKLITNYSTKTFNINVNIY